MLEWLGDDPAPRFRSPVRSSQPWNDAQSMIASILQGDVTDHRGQKKRKHRMGYGHIILMHARQVVEKVWHANLKEVSFVEGKQRK